MRRPGLPGGTGTAVESEPCGPRNRFRRGFVVRSVRYRTTTTGSDAPLAVVTRLSLVPYDVVQVGRPSSSLGWGCSRAGAAEPGACEAAGVPDERWPRADARRAHRSRASRARHPAPPVPRHAVAGRGRPLGRHLVPGRGPAQNQVALLHGGVVYTLLDVAAFLALLPLLGRRRARRHPRPDGLAAPPGGRGRASTSPGTVLRRGRAVAFMRAEATVDGEVVAAGPGDQERRPRGLITRATSTG